MTLRTDKGASERRAAQGPRVHFEAMVAVGGGEGGGFEAESVDVSADGMRLRTAYLPKVGDQLVCRFDGAEQEIVAVGEVTWVNEEARGGEFGLRFLDLDPETAAELESIVAVDEPAEAPEAPAVPAGAARGTRVKLHIEGLGSPMKARVRDGSSREVSVGSSLEFLKLGRPLEIEDVDHGERREGFVDAVKVEIDPATSVPQLVVSVRFDAAVIAAGPATIASPARAAAPAKAAEASEPKKAEPKIEAKAETEAADVKVEQAAELEATQAEAKGDDVEPVRATKSVPPKSRTAAPKSVPAKSAAAPETAAARDGQEDDDDVDLEAIGAGGASAKFRAAGDKAKELSNAAAAKIGPAMVGLGAGAKSLWSNMRATIDKRREARVEAKRAAQPRRVTAPPPSGALTSDGRRLVRQESEEEAPVSSADIPKNKRGMMMGAGAGLVLVLGIVGATKLFGGGDAPAPATVAAADRVTQEAPPALPPIPGAPATAEVPLFGATPMSTTESVVPMPGSPDQATAQAAEGEGEEAEPAEGAKGAAETVREWGEGTVKNAKVLKIRMDGPVEGFTAEETEGGFTITVPGRKSLSTASALVRKDKRLSAVDVVNRDDVVEVAVKFKGDMPAHKVKVVADRLEIALGSGAAAAEEEEAPAPKKVASKTTSKKKPASKKKK